MCTWRVQKIRMKLWHKNSITYDRYWLLFKETNHCHHQSIFEFLKHLTHASYCLGVVGEKKTKDIIFAFSKFIIWYRWQSEELAGPHNFILFYSIHRSRQSSWQSCLYSSLPTHFQPTVEWLPPPLLLWSCSHQTTPLLNPVATSQFLLLTGAACSPWNALGTLGLMFFIVSSFLSMVTLCPQLLNFSSPDIL